MMFRRVDISNSILFVWVLYTLVSLVCRFVVLGVRVGVLQAAVFVI